MSLTDKFDPRPTVARDCDSLAVEQRSRAATTLLVAAVVFAILALIFAAGHPLIAIWAALILVGWLFIAGAAKASGD